MSPASAMSLLLFPNLMQAYVMVHRGGMLSHNDLWDQEGCCVVTGGDNMYNTSL